MKKALQIKNNFKWIKYIFALFFFTSFNSFANTWYSLEGKGSCVPFSTLAQHVPEFKNTTTPQDVFTNYKKKNKETRLVDYADVVRKYDGFNIGDFNPPKGSAYLLAINNRSFWILIRKDQCKKFSR